MVQADVNEMMNIISSWQIDVICVSASLCFLKSYISPSSILFLILSLSCSEVEGQLGSSVWWDRYTSGVFLERWHILQYFLAPGLLLMVGSIWDW